MADLEGKHSFISLFTSSEGGVKCHSRVDKCEESPVDASLFPANRDAFKKMNNVFSEWISLTYQMFAFIHLFTRVAAERRWKWHRYFPQQAEFGCLAIRLFI